MGTSPIPRDALPLSRNYRIRDIVGNVSVPDAFSAGAADLLDSEPLVKVVQRLARLPMPMADNVRERVSSLPRLERRDLIKKLLRIASSPVSQWHIVSLLQLGGDAAEMRLARRIARRALLPTAASEFEAYKAVVLWSAQEFRSFGGVSTGMRLAFAWAHAHQIFVFFKALGASIDWIKDCFESLNDRVRFGPLEEESKLRADVSHPVHLTREVFLLGGLYYGFSPSKSRPLATGITDLFWRIAVRPSEVGPFLALPLLLDARVVIDELRGFLGGDRHQKLVALAPEGERESVQAIVAETTLEKTVIGLATHNQEPAWWGRLYTVLGSSPVPPEHCRQVMDIALGADFPAIASSDPDEGYLALHIASTYARHMSDDALRERLSEALIDIASLFAKRGHVDRSDTTWTCPQN